MRCYNCGRKLASLDTCSYCGADVRMYGRAAAISNALYNEALYQAGNRELTGAIDTLRLSLRYIRKILMHETCWVWCILRLERLWMP